MDTRVYEEYVTDIVVGVDVDAGGGGGGADADGFSGFWWLTARSISVAVVW